jgi:ABC-type amino acid transport substrate-binding protein
MTSLPSGSTHFSRARPRTLPRRYVLGGLVAAMASPLTGHATTTASARIAVPGDVADDLPRFLDGSDVATLQHFRGPHARRDVMELAFLLREMRRALPAMAVELVRIDSYERLLIELSAGRVDALGTSAWMLDLAQAGTTITRSSALLANGEFVVGLYTAPGNQAALAVRRRAQLKDLTVVSNSAWTADWNTLGQLGLKQVMDVKTWNQMVLMVANRRADLLLAPFPAKPSLELVYEGNTLVPIKGVSVALIGSRHLATAHTPAGRQIADKIFPALAARVQDGSLRRAYTECGFRNPQTAKWPLINPVRT